MGGGQVNAGKFFADQLGEKIKAEKTLVQKSGYFARSAAPNDEVGVSGGGEGGIACDFSL
jgi:hypothetical protein